MHAEGVCFSHFHASPVCSPTRASLMTGRYNFRTGAIDTYLGRSMMRPDEVTLPQLLAANGYRTGIFGKWHLGDNYPMRAMDRGFEEALVHNGGGLAQPSGPPGDGYFDPMLSHNGVWAKHSGYCTDIFTSAAIAFIARHRAEPFFVYLATNAPHMPLQVADEYSAPYLAMGLDEETAKTYAMITNIDDNVGRLFAALDELGLDRNTIVIFLTDNGPAFGGVERYNAGMRGQKGTVYEGGIRVPCFVRWPGVIPSGKAVDRLAAHIDLLPTILNACRVSPPAMIPWTLVRP
jgi:arylsulfatase A-like enzyme